MSVNMGHKWAIVVAINNQILEAQFSSGWLIAVGKRAKILDLLFLKRL